MIKYVYFSESCRYCFRFQIDQCYWSDNIRPTPQNISINGHITAHIADLHGRMPNNPHAHILLNIHNILPLCLSKVQRGLLQHALVCQQNLRRFDKSGCRGTLTWQQWSFCSFFSWLSCRLKRSLLRFGN